MNNLSILLGIKEFTPPSGVISFCNDTTEKEDVKKTHTPIAELMAKDDARWKQAFGGRKRTRKYLAKKLGYKSINASLLRKIKSGKVVKLVEMKTPFGNGHGIEQYFKWVGK